MKEIRRIKEMVSKRKENLKLSGNVYFLNDSMILNFPREDGDSRYPLDIDGYTVWTQSSGYIYAREGGFYSLAWRQEGEDPDVDFFAGLTNGKGGYEYFSLLGIPADPADSEIKRYTVFTPLATYYFTEYKDVEFCVRVYVEKERDLYFSVYVENKSYKKKEILLSTYFDPFLRVQISKNYDDRWVEETHITDSLCNNLKNAVSVTRNNKIYSLIQSNMIPEPIEYYTTSSRDDYVGGKSRSLANNLSLVRGKFPICMPNCFGTHNSVYGDIRIISLSADEESRTDVRFKIFANEIPAYEFEHKIIAEEIDSRLSTLSNNRLLSDDRLKIQFGKSTDGKINNEAFNCFIQFVKRQTELCSFTKYYGWAEHLGIRDVWQQIEPTLFWKYEKFRERVLELLSVTESTGRSPRQYRCEILEFPCSFDLRQYVDQGVWILATLNTYLKYTGDTELFNEVCGYYEFPEGKQYITEKGCVVSSEKDTVADHMIRILDYLLSKRDKKTGCIRILLGDWNDALHFKDNENGVEDDYGDAVSVMVSLQVYSNLKDVIEVLEIVNAEKYADKISYYKEQREILEKSIISEAVVENDANEKRIVHGWNANKEFLVGSFCDQDGKSRISSTVQSFWILSGMLNKTPELKNVIINALKQLDSKFGFKTYDVPFDSSFKGLFGITGQVSGTCENAAAYIHSSAFAMYSLFKIGEWDFAWEQLNKLLPINHEFISHSPYVMSNAYMENEYFSINGDSVNDWMTGSSAVLLKTLIFAICGYQPQINGITIAPACNIPFEDFSFTLEVPNYNIKITYKKSNQLERIFIVNGKKYESEYDADISSEKIFIPYDSIDNGKELEIEVID